MRYGLRAQLLIGFVGVLLTVVAAELVWAFNMAEKKSKPAATEAAVSPAAPGTVRNTILIPLPGMTPFSAILADSANASSSDPANDSASSGRSTTVPSTTVAQQAASTSTSVTIPATIMVAVPGMAPFSARLEAPATTKAKTPVALPAAEPDELSFEEPKDYTKLAVELEMNDVVIATVEVGGPATQPALP